MERQSRPTPTLKSQLPTQAASTQPETRPTAAEETKQSEIKNNEPDQEDDEEVQRRIKLENRTRSDPIDLKLNPDDEPLDPMEQETESLIRLMQEIKQFQVASKDVAPGEISDEERRQKAEAMIMKIAAMMNLGEDQESYGEEEEQNPIAGE